ncbi:hypothetical protein H6S82_18740 [Planktothrix sp. FACHB-1355]|uniref:Uncharacterized protein n=1 Tax=Aerosakkonema funiforme FACHB-1375 TaxID=2949571 RepID=A0A926ZGL5_9CYAN|nr:MULTISPECIES: hypothetical protein [Oscillatoriales]MBD2179931.1 hypothetical protein [Aerosakkonema funiforme FACHB-1375]MBD3560871.1 hypothetical protein [Planktothrix sp. FACHB-1355]
MMKIKGIKRGRTIELSEDVNIPDAQEVDVEIEMIQQMSNEEKSKKMKDFLEKLTDEDREKWAKIGEVLEKERQMDRQLQQQKINELQVCN